MFSVVYVIMISLKKDSIQRLDLFCLCRTVQKNALCIYEKFHFCFRMKFFFIIYHKVLLNILPLLRIITLFFTSEQIQIYYITIFIQFIENNLNLLFVN